MILGFGKKTGGDKASSPADVSVVPAAGKVAKGGKKTPAVSTALLETSGLDEKSMVTALSRTSAPHVGSLRERLSAPVRVSYSDLAHGATLGEAPPSLRKTSSTTQVTETVL